MRWDEARVLVIDTETTGTDVNDDRVVELGAAYFERGKPGALHRTLVNPGRPIPAGAAAVHGITDEQVKDAPPFADVAPRFWKHIEGHEGEAPILAGYNAVWFDVPLLNAELARAGLPQRIDPARLIDPIIFARWYHRGLRSRRLGDICQHYGVPLESAHAAWADAAATGHLLFKMVEAGIIPNDVEAALAEQARLWPRLEDERVRWSHWLYEDRQDGVIRIGAGKHTGVALAEADLDYLNYMLSTVTDLPEAVRTAFSERLKQ